MVSRSVGNFLSLSKPTFAFCEHHVGCGVGPADLSVASLNVTTAIVLQLERPLPGLPADWWTPM